MVQELHQIFFHHFPSTTRHSKKNKTKKGVANGKQQRRVEVGLVIVTHALTLSNPRKANQFILGFHQKSVICL